MDLVCRMEQSEAISGRMSLRAQMAPPGQGQRVLRSQRCALRASLATKVRERRQGDCACAGGCVDVCREMIAVRGWLERVCWR